MPLGVPTIVRASRRNRRRSQSSGGSQWTRQDEADKIKYLTAQQRRQAEAERRARMQDSAAARDAASRERARDRSAQARRDAMKVMAERGMAIPPGMMSPGDGEGGMSSEQKRNADLAAKMARADMIRRYRKAKEQRMAANGPQESRMRIRLTEDSPMYEFRGDDQAVFGGGPVPPGAARDYAQLRTEIEPRNSAGDAMLDDAARQEGVDRDRIRRMRRAATPARDPWEELTGEAGGDAVTEYGMSSKDALALQRNQGEPIEGMAAMRKIMGRDRMGEATDRLNQTPTSELPALSPRGVQNVQNDLSRLRVLDQPNEAPMGSPATAQAPATAELRNEARQAILARRRAELQQQLDQSMGVSRGQLQQELDSIQDSSAGTVGSTIRMAELRGQIGQMDAAGRGQMSELDTARARLAELGRASNIGPDTYIAMGQLRERIAELEAQQPQQATSDDPGADMARLRAQLDSVVRGTAPVSSEDIDQWLMQNRPAQAGANIDAAQQIMGTGDMYNIAGPGNTTTGVTPYQIPVADDETRRLYDLRRRVQQMQNMNAPEQLIQERLDQMTQQPQFQDFQGMPASQFVNGALWPGPQDDPQMRVDLGGAVSNAGMGGVSGIPADPTVQRSRELALRQAEANVQQTELGNKSLGQQVDNPTVTPERAANLGLPEISKDTFVNRASRYSDIPLIGGAIVDMSDAKTEGTASVDDLQRRIQAAIGTGTPQQRQSAAEYLMQDPVMSRIPEIIADLENVAKGGLIERQWEAIDPENAKRQAARLRKLYESVANMAQQPGA